MKAWMLAVSALAACTLVAAPALAGSWHHITSRDAMTGASVWGDQIISSNSLRLGDPYEGENHGTVLVRGGSPKSFAIMVTVQKGQILCGVNACHLKIRFGNGPVQSLTCDPSGDDDPTLVFVRSPHWLLDRLKNARSFRIEVPMYQAGEQVLRFDASAPLIAYAAKRASHAKP